MRRAKIGLMVSLLSVPQAWTQTYPAMEGYLGYSHYNNEYGSDRHNSPGVEFNYGYNLARNLQLLADVGVQFHNTNIVWTNGKKAEADSYQFLFGPELKIRNRSKLTPFARRLQERRFAATRFRLAIGFAPDFLLPVIRRVSVSLANQVSPGVLEAGSTGSCSGESLCASCSLTGFVPISAATTRTSLRSRDRYRSSVAGRTITDFRLESLSSSARKGWYGNERNFMPESRQPVETLKQLR